MKQLVIVAALLLALMLTLTACGQIQTGNRFVSGSAFTYAYICLGGEHLTQGYITQWRDYKDSDTVQVMIDGKYYLTHYTNVVMVADPSQGNLSHSNPSLWGKEE